MPSVLDLSSEEKSEFFNLYNVFKSAEKQEDRAKASWKFLCFVNKHLGSDLLTYFVNSMFDNEDAKQVIIPMIKMRGILQPSL